MSSDVAPDPQEPPQGHGNNKDGHLLEKWIRVNGKMDASYLASVSYTQ